MALTLQQVRTLPAFADMSDSDIISHASSNGFDTSAMMPSPSEEGDIQRGFNNTFRQLPQIGYGLTAIAGATGEKVFGEGGISTGIKKAGLEGYQEASANMAEHSKPSDSLTYSWDRAKEGHFGDLADWVQHGIGYAGGQGLQLIATAGFGNLAAKEGAKAFAQNLTTKMVASAAAKIGAEDAAKVAATEGVTAMTAEAIQKAAVKSVASKIGDIGASTAMGGMAIGMEGGEIGGDLATKAQERGTPLTGTELAQGFGATIGAGALEFVGDKFGLDILTGKSKLYKALGSAPGLTGRVGRGVAAGAIAGIPEAATEYGQTLTEEYGKGNDPFSAESKQQAFDAAGQGAIGGHVMGFAGGLLSAAKPKTPEQLKADLSTTASTGALGNALATGGFTNQGDSIHDINPDNNLDLRTDAQKAQDNASIIDTNQATQTGLQGTPNPADAVPLTQPENLNGSQESTSETQNASAQEKGPLLTTVAPEQSGATSLVDNAPQDPLVSVIDRNTGTAFHVLQSDLDSNKDRLTKHSIATGKRLETPILRNDIVDQQTYQQELADQQQRQDEQANQQTETQAQDQTSADQSTAVTFQPTHELNDGTPVKQTGDNTYVDQAGDEWGSDDAKPIGRVDTATSAEGQGNNTGPDVPSYATAPLLNKRTNTPFKTRKMAEVAIASSSNPTVNPQDHIAVPVDGGFGIVPKPNTLPGNNDTATETQSVLSNTSTDAKGITAPAITDVAGQASTPAAQEVVPKTKLKQVGLAITRAAKIEHRSIDGVGGAYHRSTNDSRRSDEIHSLTQTTDANGNPDYTAHISINTPIDGASNGTKTNEGKYSLNALLNSGAISQQTHDFLVDEYHGKNNDVTEANNNHQLTADEYVSNNNAQFPNSKGINDSLRKSHYTDIRSHLDQGGKISKAVFDSLDGLRRTNLIKNYGEDIIEAEAIKQPSNTQATETVAKPQESGDLSSNDPAKVPQVAQPTLMKRNVELHTVNGTVVKGDRYLFPGNERHPIIITKPSGNKGAATKQNHVAWDEISGSAIYMEPPKVYKDKPSAQHVIDVVSNQFNSGFGNKLDGHDSRIQIKASVNDQANKQPWEMTDREYGQHKDKEHEARRLENLAKVNADLDTLTNKSEGYDALMAKETAKVAHTITPEGKFSHNLRSGSRVYNSADQFVLSQLLKRKKNIESHSDKFRSSFATDMSTQHAALQKAIDAGKTIPQNVLDSLPSNFPELKYPSVQESAKKPDWEMTRDEYKNSFDPRDYKDSNYDKMIHAAVFNEKITQAEADKKLIRYYSGNKYHWAKTRKELEQDKKEAVKNAKAARAESNKNPTHAVKWAQKSESNTAKNNITSTNLHHNKLLEVHKERVQEALSEGKPVPQEVLADYPDIKAPVQEIANPSHDTTDVSKKGENVATAKPEWHIDIPEHGLSILPAELKGEGYRTVAGRIAKDAVDAITQNQKIANDTLYLYFLPAAENHNAIARYFPEDQKPGSPWQISDSQGVRVGSLTNDQLLYKTESFMGNEPILGWEKTPANTTATKQEEVASTLKPALGNYIQPKATASAEDQKRLASRGSRIATLSGINEAVRNSNPDYAYSDSEIQSAADDKIDAGIDWLISKQKPSVNKGETTKGTVVADKAESNIQDFGEKLEGAKKFTYTFKEALSEDIDIAAVPLSKSFPQPDYEKLIAGGINPQVAALIAQLRAEIPTKPSKSYRVSKWVAQVTAIREAADHLLSGDLTVEQFIQAGKDKDNYTKYMGDVLAIADSILPSQIKELGNFKLQHSFYWLHSGVKDVWKWSVINTASKSSWGKQFDTKEEAVAYIKSEISTENTKGESIAKFDRWTERGKPGVVFVGKKIASGKYITLKEFPTSKEALNYTIEHNTELVELLKQKKKDKEIRRAENNQRVGKDYRNGKNVSAKEFTDTFGFRGVQFGNWVENDRRQQDLNNAYDGLIDLAEVLGIPPKALALNGELGLAFGARGSGGENAAAAHYESNSVVINLTKKNGAGSLAHEWWHAVDNYFGKQESDGFLSDKGARRAQILDGNKYRESTDSDFAVRKEVFDAWQGVTKAIRTETQLVRRSVIKDKTRSKNYYATITEMTARSFERYVIGKLEDQGYSNDYLANIIPESTIDAQEKIEESDYPFPLQSEMAAVNKAYDKLFDTLETKETEKGTALFSKSTTPVVNPHSKTTLNQAVTKAMDTLFGQGWTNRLMATGKFKMISAAEATGIIGKNAMFHKVWHGSPHDHNKFDSAYIDTGEGAQAFGWGHYFSDLKTVAEWYRDKLSHKRLQSKDGIFIDDAVTNSQAAMKILREAKVVIGNNKGIVEFKEDLRNKSERAKRWAKNGDNVESNTSFYVAAEEILPLLDGAKFVTEKGKLYEVDLAPNQDEYLDWDKPLSQQSDVVKAGLKELHKQLEGDQLNEYLDRINADWIELTGQELYQNILERSHQDGLFDHPDIYDRSVPNDEASSHLLHSLGIRGIRYKAEQGQSEANNYVVFNDADVKIEVKYSKNGDVIAFYNPADDTTYLVHDNITKNTSDKALQGLMLHEIGVHALTLGKSNEVFKDILRRFEALKATNPKVQAAFNRVPKDTKAEDITEEALAYYLEDHPRSSLAQRIVEWFRQAVRALGKTLPVLERAKFSQWANKLTEAELIGMATSALKSAPDSLQFDNVGRNREGIKLSDKDNEAIKQYLEVEAKYFNADGSEKSGAMLAPNGERTNLTKLQWIQVRTDNFKRFYGDWEKDGIELRGMASNVEKSSHERGVYSGGTSTSRPRNSGPLVADNGEPVIFYHGTKDIIEKGFDLDHPNKKDKGWLGRGVYAYDSYGASFMHAGNKEGARSLVNVISLFMAVKHPYIADDSVKNKLKNSNQEGIQEFTQDLIDKGYDGAIMLHKELGNVIEIVSFSTNAVKSATGNNGDFSQSNNNIKFSRSTPSNTPADNSAMRSFFAPAKGKQALGWLAGLFQRNHLIDFVAQDLPELVNYKLLSQAKDNFTNQRENKIGESYKEMMDKMDAKTMHELGRVQGMATRLVTFDPATADYNTPMTEEERAVYDAYSAMPEGAKEVYATMRNAYQDDLTEKKNALIERIKAFPADKETQAEIISTIQKHFDQFKEGVYFPLNRDGAVIVKATNADGELVIEHVATQAAAYKLVQEMTAQGYDNTHIIGKDAYDRDLLAGNAANEMATLAHKTISDLKEKSIQGKLTESDFNDLFSEFNQLLINTLPDSSYRKHFIHRKGTLGESTDTLRAYSKTRVSAVKMIASLTYDHQIQDVLNNADKAIKKMDKVAGSDTLAIKSIVNELKLREAALKSTEINAVSQVLTSLGFMGALGFNIGSAAVNMLQVVGVALPELVGKHGYVEATKEISAAYKLLFNPTNLDKASGLDITKNPNLSAIAKQAMEYLASIGKIDLTMTHDSIAAGKNPSYSSNPLTRAFGAAAKYSGYFFHVAEAANRQVTGMAAFNLAYQKNGGDFKAAIADAIDVIDRTQFDYGQGNRARYMMSNTARVLTLFKSYALGMSYFIGRNAYQSMKGETPEVRLQAKKTLIASMAMSFATAGLFGMPIGLEAFAGIGGVSAFKYKGAKFAVPGAIGGMLIFQALLAGLGADDEDELETEFRNWLTDNFDQTIAEWVTKGPARLLPIGDIAGRTSLSELWWRSQNKQLEGTDQYNAIATALIGPIGSQVAGLFTAKKMYEDGQYSRMVESMSPAFLRNAIAANRMGTEGVTNLKGDKIIQRDLTPVELINKIIGFNPTVVTNTYDANSAIAKESTKHTLAKSHLVNQWMSGDATERSDLMKGAIKDFNESVPPSERITLKSLFKSMRSRKGIDKHTQNGLYLSKKQNYLRDLGRFNRQE